GVGGDGVGGGGRRDQGSVVGWSAEVCGAVVVGGGGVEDLAGVGAGGDDAGRAVAGGAQVGHVQGVAVHVGVIGDDVEGLGRVLVRMPDVVVDCHGGGGDGVDGDGHGGGGGRVHRAVVGGVGEGVGAVVVEVGALSVLAALRVCGDDAGRAVAGGAQVGHVQGVAVHVGVIGDDVEGLG